MKICLDYGEDGLFVNFPEHCTTVIEPQYPPGVAKPAEELQRALREPSGSVPVRELVGPGKTVAISVCDGTRAQPREQMLKVLLDEMRTVPAEDIVILIATGTHRANTDEELEYMLGKDIVSHYRVVNHDARDRTSLVHVGQSSRGIPIWLNRLWVGADVRITTGFVEPHFFAGFSGGPKMVAPGLAGLDTTMILHNAERIGHPMATWGVTDGNPIHNDVRDIARMTGVDFAVDVTLNGAKEITMAFAGDLFEEHRLACINSRREAMRAVDKPFEIVVTTNSGYPLDQNLYQAIKGMSAAAKVVKEGGLIICVAECRDGLPDHGAYADLLKCGSSPGDLLRLVNEPGFAVPDQWNVQVQALIQKRARVMVHSNHLSRDQLQAAHFEPAEDIESVVSKELEKRGTEARLCVLPRGPQTIPYVLES